MITVGTTGCGFAGSALKTWLEEDNKDVTVVVSDPPKGMNAFAKMTDGTPLGTLHALLHGLNFGFRGYEEHI